MHAEIPTQRDRDRIRGAEEARDPSQRETESGAPGTGAAHPGWERQPVPLAAARGPNSPFLRVAETLLLLSLRLESQRQLPAAAPDAQTKKIQTSFGLAHFQLRICPQE